MEGREPVPATGRKARARLEVQVLILQSCIAVFYCVGAATGLFGMAGTARWASIAWIGGYHVVHAWYVVGYRIRNRQKRWFEVATPLLDVSCITAAWLALADPESAFWGVYLYALVGYGRRIQGRAYLLVAIFIIANIVIGHGVVGGGGADGWVDADLVTMVVLATAMATLSAAIGTAWRNAEQQARTLADTDSLTSLPNRRSFLQWLDEHTADANAHFCILMLDLDDFKRTNDEHGHVYGDFVLVAVARVLGASVRPHDKVARYGGEEFVIALSEIGLAEASVVAERLREAIEEDTPITVSIGCAERARGETADGVIRRADDVLLAAKRHGKNTVRTTQAAA